MENASIEATLREAAARLSEAGVDSPRLDAELLLAHALGRDRAYLLAHPEQPLSPKQSTRFDALVARRAAREPLAYITGRRWFFGLEFEVTRDALIPRPETETLVEMALDWLARRDDREQPRVADVGTGSGAIAVSLAMHAAVEIVALDASFAALRLARANARRHRVAARIHFVQGDLLAPLAATFDLIVANLPYIPTADLAHLMPEVRDYEPRSALDGGPDGLRVIERLLAQAPARLKKGGALLLEIGHGQGENASALARRYFPRARVEVHRDLAGRERVLAIIDDDGLGD